jgi:hypothetical protein
VISHRWRRAHATGTSPGWHGEEFPTIVRKDARSFAPARLDACLRGEYGVAVEAGLTAQNASQLLESPVPSKPTVARSPRFPTVKWTPRVPRSEAHKG